jgi:group II intron reverse transcriptase/maturase
LRALGISAFYDRIVQEAVRTILQIIYEPIFSNHSHGFRPGRGCHSALRHLRKGSQGFAWAIEGDIQGFCDYIDHSVLLNILNKKIKDPRFISIINALLKVKVKVQEEGNRAQISKIGTTQGSILSPLLSNIFLHEFDLFMEDYINEFNKGKARKTKPEYRRAYRNYGAIAARKVGYSDFMDKNYRRMNYVRYADDFIITIIGTKTEALAIKQKCTAFLQKLNLTLSDENTFITNPKDRPVSFLGYVIQNQGKRQPVVLGLQRPGKRGTYAIGAKARGNSRRFPFIPPKYNGVMRRVLGNFPGGIYLKADSTKVTQRLYEKGFCQKSGHPIANFKYLNNTQHATILQMVYILRGLANYYKLANNSRQMISH